MSRAAKNFHLPMSEELHRRLQGTAQRLGAPATAVARQALEAWLEENERTAVHEAVAEYARAAAGTPADMDEALESAATESLLGHRPRKRK